MTQQNVERRFRTVGDGSGLCQEDIFYREEVQLALRNRGMPLEGLRYPITPVGMHYLLVHFDIPYVDAQNWGLNIGGLVSTPLSLTLEDIKSRPSRTIAVTMECAGDGRALLTPRSLSQPWTVEAIGTAEWTGTPLKGVLEEAGLGDETVEILFTGLDQGVQGDEVQYYQRSLTVAEATREEVLLAYEMNGQPLQPQHGYPLRLIVPGWYGMTSVKWLDRIEAIAEPFQGYQMIGSYRYSQSAEDPGEPVSRIRVKSVMIPPGIPDFLTRTRLVKAGTVTLTGRAWAGLLGVSRVEVSDDNGQTWKDAELGQQVSPYAWREWSCQWQARPGRYTLCGRATDTEGNVQPVEQPWNYQGMGNNMVHRVEVVVE
jgi:DMSO/TMAO reductase YedYZ molybdopterin-dependent catalytic subunit